jgi:formate-dependent nitrite reductase membrane component NrfD
MNLSEMTWGVTLWFDLWAVGIASAAFMAAFVINKFGGNKQPNLFRLAVYSGIVFALIGVTLLLSHLGHILWFWHMFVIVRPQSVLSLGGWILSLWLMVSGIMAVIWIAKFFSNGMKDEGNKAVCVELCDRLTSFLSWAGFFLSILLVSYGGVLIATTSRPIWSTSFLLPPLFIVSAMCTGLAWLILVSLIANWATGVSWLGGIMKILFGSADWKIDRVTVHKLARALVITSGATMVVLAAFILWLFFKTPDAVTDLITGNLAVLFWGGLVGFCLLLPTVLLLLTWNRGVSQRRDLMLAVGGSCIAVVSGLILRAVILIAGQI